MPKPQSAASHTSSDPIFLTTGIFLLLNFAFAVYYTIHQWPVHSRSHLWWIVMSCVFISMLMTTRRYAIKNQDRIIRLEERFRYAAVLDMPQINAAAALTLSQIIALRFASDPELPALIRRTLQENLTPKQIKAAITTWIPDHNRV